MDWFERLTGFREVDCDATRERLRVEGDELVSLANGSRHGIGRLELPSLRELRRRVANAASAPRGGTVRNGVGDVRALHRAPEFEGALFQVASR